MRYIQPAKIAPSIPLRKLKNSTDIDKFDLKFTQVFKGNEKKTYIKEYFDSLKYNHPFTLFTSKYAHEDKLDIYALFVSFFEIEL